MIARFTKGVSRFDVSSYPFGVDFIPPAASFAYNIATGGASNNYGGGELIGEKVQVIDFSIKLRILGTSAGAIDAARASLATFLKADGPDPLYFEYCPYDIPETLWGQGLYRYEVLTADVGIGPEYSSAKLRESGISIVISLKINGVVNGKKQCTMWAQGAVWYDRLGRADGQAWGIRLPEASTNKGLNPVFSNSITGWTAGASLVRRESTDPRYLFPGSAVSVFLTALAAANNTYTENITAGNTNPHSIAGLFYRPDGEPVTSNDVVMYHGAAKATTFQHLGNGLYLGYSDNFAATAAATATGVQVKSGRSVYFLGYIFEEKAYHTPIFFGEMLGCAWTGSVGSSSSSSTAGNLYLIVDRDTFSTAQWSVHIVWKSDYASTATGDRYFFTCGATSIRAYYNATDDKIYLSDNTNTISSAAQAFSAGDTLDLIFTGGPGGLNIYKNGANVATGATYTPPADPSFLWLGFDGATSTKYAGGIIRLFNTYGTEISSGDAASVYSSISGAITDGRILDPIPAQWGSSVNVGGNHNDSGHDNFSVVLGIPGSLPADTILTGYSTEPFSTIGAATIGLLTLNNFSSPKHLYGEYDGTADAGSSNGAYNAFALTTTTLSKAAGSISVNTISELAGKRIMVMARVNDQGSNLKVGLSFTFSTITVVMPSKAVTIPNTFSLWVTDSFSLPEYKDFHLDEEGTAYGTSSVNMTFVRTTGTANIQLDWLQVMPRPCVRIASTEGISTFVLQGSKAVGITTATAQFLSTTGDDGIWLEPNKYNCLIFGLGTTAIDPVITWSLGFTRIAVIPRWGIL